MDIISYAHFYATTEKVTFQTSGAISSHCHRACFHGGQEPLMHVTHHIPKIEAIDAKI